MLSALIEVYLKCIVRNASMTIYCSTFLPCNLHAFISFYAKAIAKASAAGGSSASATAQALASAISQGGGVSSAVAQAVAQAYGSSVSIHTIHHCSCFHCQRAHSDIKARV